MKLPSRLFMLSLCMSFIIPRAALTASETEYYDINRFISPEICGDCHGDIYNQWKNSMHALSQKDTIYLNVSDFLLKGLIDRGEIAEAESCVKCHTPVGFVTGYPKKTSDDRMKIPETAVKGIQCDYCHSAISVEKMFNNGLKLEPGNGEDDPGIKRGPLNDSESDFHGTEFSELHTRSEICGTCHNVKHVVFNTDLETTYDEWKNSPYNSADPEKRVTCQGCHMHQRPGIPATGSTDRPDNTETACDGCPERKHVYTHYFVGGNAIIPGWHNDPEKNRMAEERLKNAVSMSLDKNQIKKGTLVVRITNTGAGHYLPTGLTDIREMWLDIDINDDRGNPVYSSGKLDKNNYMPDNALIYNTVFGDGKGKPVSNITKAREIIKDNRIPPQKTISETILLPSGKWKALTVNVKLLYRSAPQKIVDEIFGRGKIKLPVITMSEISEEISM